jgi:hypothetical protein
MSRITPDKIPYRILLSNLERKETKSQPRWMVIMTPEQSFEALRRVTGQDFGDDTEMWVKWLKKNWRSIKQWDHTIEMKDEEALILNLQQKIPTFMKKFMKAKHAYQALKRITGQDFGYNVEAWEKWFREKADNEQNNNLPSADN